MKGRIEGMEETTALVLEGRRRGLSYGKLVDATSQEERDEIVRRYRRAMEAREKRKVKKKAAAP